MVRLEVVRIYETRSGGLIKDSQVAHLPTPAERDGGGWSSEQLCYKMLAAT